MSKPEVQTVTHDILHRSDAPDQAETLMFDPIDHVILEIQELAHATPSLAEELGILKQALIQRQTTGKKEKKQYTFGPVAAGTSDALAQIKDLVAGGAEFKAKDRLKKIPDKFDQFAKKFTKGQTRDPQAMERTRQDKE